MDKSLLNFGSNLLALGHTSLTPAAQR